jgi:uncharacterized protein YggE
MYQYLSENQKKYIFNSLLAVFITLAAFITVKVINTIKEYSYIGRGTYAANVITVSGKGEVITIPDTGSFSFSVVEEGKTVKDAQDKASKKVNDVIAAIKSMGVEEKDIKTESYNSNPKYEYNSYPCPEPLNVSGSASSYPCRQGKNVLIGYEVSQSITVKIRKTADAGEILTKVGSLNVSNISGLNFIVDDLDAVQAKARDMAITDAKTKAKALSKSLGVRLNKIVNFYESGNGPIYYGAMEMSSAKGMGGDVAVAPQLPVGENKITSNITITYEVQ